MCLLSIAQWIVHLIFVHIVKDSTQLVTHQLLFVYPSVLLSAALLCACARPLPQHSSNIEYSEIQTLMQELTSTAYDMGQEQLAALHRACTIIEEIMFNASRSSLDLVTDPAFKSSCLTVGRQI